MDEVHLSPTPEIPAAPPHADPPHLQVAALCLRGKGSKKEVLVISSLGTGRWILPKGWPMRGRTLAQAALREAWEEAGVKGSVSEKIVGRYSYDKITDSGSARHCEVQVFPVTVKNLTDNFPEAGKRQRKWVKPARAAQMVDEPDLKALLLTLAD